MFRRRMHLWLQYVRQMLRLDQIATHDSIKVDKHVMMSVIADNLVTNGPECETATLTLSQYLCTNTPRISSFIFSLLIINSPLKPVPSKRYVQHAAVITSCKQSRCSR